MDLTDIHRIFLSNIREYVHGSFSKIEQSLKTKQNKS